MPTAPHPPLHNRTAEARLALSPRGSRVEDESPTPLRHHGPAHTGALGLHLRSKAWSFPWETWHLVTMEMDMLAPAWPHHLMGPSQRPAG